MATRTEPEDPDQISAVAGVAALFWELEHRDQSRYSSFNDAQAAGETVRFERLAVELWRRGWLDIVAIVSDVGGTNSA